MMNTAQTPHPLWFRLSRDQVVPTVKVIAAVGIGVAIPVSGFTPIDHASDVLGLATHPLRVILMPTVLLALAAVILSRLFPKHATRLPTAVSIAGLGLVVAGCLSLFHSNNTTNSAELLVAVLVAPIVLFYGLRRCDLRFDILCAAFLVATAALVIRADWVFFKDYGFPSGRALYAAKNANSIYDFHYYGLGNPDSFGAFLLIPLSLSAFWASGTEVGRVARASLACSAALFFLTIVLVYIRLPMILGVGIIAGALLIAPVSRRVRWVALACIVAGVGAFVTGAATSTYLAKALSTNDGASGIVRVTSIVHGLHTMVEHPLTGVGLGRYGIPPKTPAHSSIAEAGAEMGILGLIALTLLAAWLIRRASVHVRDRRWDGPRPGAGIALGVFAIYTVIAGGALLGLANGFDAVWVLSVVLMLTVSEPTAGTPDNEIDGLGTSRAPAGLTHFLLALVGVGFAIFGVADLHEAGSFTPATSAAWSFPNRLPAGWTASRSVKLASEPPGVRVTTGGLANAYQLFGPQFLLRQGTYVLRVNATVLRGAIGAELLDVRRERFLAATLGLSQASSQLRSGIRFVVSSPTVVQVILSAAGPPGSPSIWIVRGVQIRPASADISAHPQPNVAAGDGHHVDEKLSRSITRR